MGSLLDWLKETMLGVGTGYDTEDTEETEYNRYDRANRYDVADDEEAEAYHDGSRNTSRTRSSEVDYINTRRPAPAKGSNILEFQGANMAKTQVVLTCPTDVQDATVICDHVRDNKTCVVNLEGVPREKAQRIADFLGGVAFALSGEIERISNEIFIIAPLSVHIDAQLKEELKAGGHVLSWASSFK